MTSSCSGLDDAAIEKAKLYYEEVFFYFNLALLLNKHNFIDKIYYLKFFGFENQ